MQRFELATVHEVVLWRSFWGRHRFPLHFIQMDSEQTVSTQSKMYRNAVHSPTRTYG